MIQDIRDPKRYPDARHYRVRLDGVDVSDRTVAFNTDEGWVEMYEINGAGQFFKRGSVPAIERVSGQLQVRRIDE